MLLGSGELGKEVIIALQRLGVEVIAVDRYPNAPGHQVAHRAHVINMTDGAALAALIEQEKPDLVVPEIEAIATDKLAELEAAGKITCIPTARRAADHEPRRHPPPGRRNPGPGHLALPFRQQPGRTAGRR
jgi:phosphoribosylglycinamide formyltransferase 2